MKNMSAEPAARFKA